MAWMFHKATESWEEVPDAQVQQAYLSGEYGVREDEAFTVIGKSGKTYNVRGADLDTALNSGQFRIQTTDDIVANRQKREYKDRPAQAALAGVTRGITAGFGDAAQIKMAGGGEGPLNVLTGQVDPSLGVGAEEKMREHLNMLKAHNKKASMAGELAGVLATAAATPGLGSAKTAGQAILRGAALGIGEGAVFGAGGTASELALAGEEISGEKVLAGAGLGALIGGTTGGLFAGGGHLASKYADTAADLAKRTLSKRGSSGFLREWAEARAVKSTGAMLKNFRAMTRQGKVSERGRWLLDEGVVKAGRSLDEIAEVAAQKADDAGKAIGRHLDEIDEAGRTFDMVGTANAIRREVLEPLSERPGVWRKVSKRINKWLDEAMEGGEKITFRKAEQLKRALDDEIPYLKANWTPYDKTLARVRGMLKEAVETQADDAARAVGRPGFLDEFRAAKKAFGHAHETRKIATDMLDRRNANRWFTPSDYGSALGGMLLGVAGGDGDAIERGMQGLAMGAALGLGNRFLRAHGNQIAAVAVDRLAGTAIDSAARKAAVDAADRLITKKVQDAARTFFTKQGAAAVRQATQRKILTTSYARETRTKIADRIEAFNDRVSELGHWISNPEQFAERVGQRTEGLEQISPGLATSTQMSVYNAAHFLWTKAPKNPAAGRTLNPAVQKWRPSDMELAKWERYVEAVEDPMSVLDDLNAGRINREGIETLKTVYPRIYEEVQTVFLDHLSETRENLNYRDRLQLSILFDVPLEVTMEPGFVAAIQQRHAQITAEDEAAKQRPKSGKFDKLTLDQSSMTSSQKQMEA